jgi:aryl-alcohol dehydrogenase-like predicted oxidoreductase
MRAIEDSLRRLNTDYIDLYQMHRPDPTVPIDETLDALTDLVRRGKVRYIGSSTFSGSQIVEAQWAAERLHLQRFVTEQPSYSILAREIEVDILPTTQRHGMGVLTYTPLAAGWLSGSWTNDSLPTSPARKRLSARFDMTLPANQRKLEVVEQLADVAQQAGITMIELSIALVLRHPGVSAAIIGPRTMQQLESQLPGATTALNDDILDRIDEIATPGVTINQHDTNYGERELAASARRR